MTTLRSAQVVVCAGALAIAAGCSKDHEPEGTAAPEPAVTEGSEMGEMGTSSADTTEMETQRMEESSRESSAAKTTDDKAAQGGPVHGGDMQAMPGQTGAMGAEAATTVTDSEIAFIS